MGGDRVIAEASAYIAQAELDRRPKALGMLAEAFLSIVMFAVGGPAFSSVSGGNDRPPAGSADTRSRPLTPGDTSYCRAVEEVVMIVLAVLVVAIVIARVAGVAGVARLNSWPAAVRVGLAVMLLFTASAHFTATRHDLARMVPDVVPYPMAVVYFTGVCEILGAIGLLIPRVRLAAGVALIVFFIAVLPANIHATRAGVTLRRQPATPLALRIPMQVLFIGLTWWSVVSRHGRRSAALLLAFSLALVSAVPQRGEGQEAERGKQVRVEASVFLDAVRAGTWDAVASFVSLDDVTRSRMGIGAGASPEAIRSRVQAWFRSVLGRVPPGRVVSVRIDPRDPDLALVTYRHGDLDAFTMRYVGGRWLYTLASEPARR